MVKEYPDSDDDLWTISNSDGSKAPKVTQKKNKNVYYAQLNELIEII